MGVTESDDLPLLQSRFTSPLADHSATKRTGLPSPLHILFPKNSLPSQAFLFFPLLFCKFLTIDCSSFPIL